MNRPKLVGLTGGIGAGKSTVASIFKLLGVPVYDADGRAKSLMNTDQELVEAIQEVFGEAAYDNGKLNRAYLADRVFKSESATNKLNAMVHPAVARDFTRWASEQQAPYIIKEAALLFETDSYQQLACTILVVSSIELRMRRISHRDPQRSQEQIRNIIQRQLPVEQAMEFAQYCIYNDEQQLLLPQVLAIHEQLKE